ncbi:MAG TPA: SAM-dependent methyltransferase, partial [Ruminococcus sp.]|nr:SAM-dependent methyltransferase [Ruminococcus sp.]
MDITQTFYNNMASKYDRLFADWNASVVQQAELLHGLFRASGFDAPAEILDCACGIG